MAQGFHRLIRSTPSLGSHADGLFWPNQSARLHLAKIKWRQGSGQSASSHYGNPAAQGSDPEPFPSRAPRTESPRYPHPSDNHSVDQHSGSASAAMSPTKLERTDYHVAWIAPVSDLEVLPSRLMLDDEHDVPDYDTAYDDNVYTCGRMVGHNVIIATCPPGLTGNVNAGRVTGAMFKTFPCIRMAVLVGIGGGIPQALQSDYPTENVQLGDVVVGWPGDGGPACVYFDSGRWHTDGHFETLGTIDKPDRVLLNALAKLVTDHDVDRSTFQEHRGRLLRSRHKRKFTFPGLDQDLLFEAAYTHHGQYGNKCASCDIAKLVHRPARTEADAAGFHFHRGRIATGNAVIQDGTRRDQIRDLCDGALCVEMEAAGVDASRSCLVIRGISDYADSHKGDVWRSYAAGNAAVFARELLSKIPPSKALGLGSQA